MYSIWPKFGFKENPYSNLNLPGNELGLELLVGRQKEVAKLQRKIASTGTQPTVEGPPGIGKTSLLAVTGYEMFSQSVSAKSGTLYLPAEDFFQANKDAVEFEAEVLRSVAQTLINKVEAFKAVGLPTPNLSALNTWLNKPHYKNGGAGAAGFSVNYGSEPNTSEGFTASGFAALVKKELRKCFPTPESGAIICVVDNLELLQTSKHARDSLDELRDPLFNVEGLRWVLCGSRGMVSHARSERLSGIFEPPIRVDALPREATVDLIERRVKAFSNGGTSASAPVTAAAFEYLYDALSQNLRDALAYAQNFSDWLYEAFILEGEELPAEEQRVEAMRTWLASQADEAHAQAKLQPRVWKLFADLAKMGGRGRSADFRDFDFTTQQQMGAAISDLVEANLVVRETDPDKASRSIAAMTPQGWLVWHHLSRYSGLQQIV